METGKLPLPSNGNALTKLLSESGVRPGARVLDAASSVGTQSIGLLQHGYNVTSSDISPGAINRLRS